MERMWKQHGQKVEIRTGKDVDMEGTGKRRMGRQGLRGVGIGHGVALGIWARRLRQKEGFGRRYLGTSDI
jgi:hypothetical protein